MDTRVLHIRLGIAASLAGLFFIFYAIPNWVGAPSNIPNIVLSPYFWPYCLAGFTALTGLGLIFTGMRTPPSDTPLNPPSDDTQKAVLRLVGLACIMVATMMTVRTLGMVWTSMLAFAATAFLVRTRHPKAALVCAVVVPLALYAFFAHVAGVAIPQGAFVRLP